MPTEHDRQLQQNAENLKSFLLRVAENEPRLVWDACLYAIEIIARNRVERNFIRRLIDSQSLN